MLFLFALFVLGIASGAAAGIVGFGIGSLLTPLLLTRMEPALAIAAVSIPHLAATSLRCVQHRRYISRSILLRFGLPSVAGGLAGAWVQGSLSARTLSIVLGGLLIATALANLTRGFGNWRPGTPAAVALGTLSGFLGGIAGNQGGFRTMGLLAFDLSPRAFLATSTAVGVLIDLGRTPIYVARAGAALVPLAVPIAVAAAGCLVGTILGERALLGMSPDRYRVVVAAAVGALGIWLLTRAF